MILEILYTQRFEETLGYVNNFIENKFGSRAADKFAAKLQNTIQLIGSYPFMYKPSGIDENIRVAVISKQTSLFYRVTQTQIHLLFLWDNRQEPFNFSM